MINNQRIPTDSLKGAQPRYVAAYRKLVEMVSGMAAGDQLPTEETLAKEFGISRNTLRQALQLLHEDKLIYKRKGLGTFVSGTPYLGKSDLSNYQSAQQSIRRLGIETDVLETTITIEKIDKITAEWLGKDEDSCMFYVSRIISNKKDNDIRYFFCEDYVPADIGIELTKFNKDEFVQTYEAMGGASLCNITSISSGDFHSEKLRVEKGTPVVVLQQIVLDSNGKKIYLNKTYVNTENTDNSLVITRHSFV